MPFTYILRCADGSYYVGSTRDLERRLAQHDAGEAANYTRRRRPVELVWAHEFQLVDDAFALEKRVQNWSRAKREALIEGGSKICRGSAAARTGGGVSTRRRRRLLDHREGDLVSRRVARRAALLNQRGSET
jgi:putative endonuclease